MRFLTKKFTCLDACYEDGSTCILEVQYHPKNPDSVDAPTMCPYTGDIAEWKEITDQEAIE